MIMIIIIIIITFVVTIVVVVEVVAASVSQHLCQVVPHLKSSHNTLPSN
jgi:hypothetical protein